MKRGVSRRDGLVDWPTSLSQQRWRRIEWAAPGQEELKRSRSQTARQRPNQREATRGRPQGLRQLKTAAFLQPFTRRPRPRLTQLAAVHGRQYSTVCMYGSASWRAQVNMPLQSTAAQRQHARNEASDSRTECAAPAPARTAIRTCLLECGHQPKCMRVID